MSDQPTILDLPAEVLEEIFLNCLPWDLLKLTETCKRFNEVVANSSRLLSLIDVTFRERTGMKSVEYINAIISSSRNYKTASLRVSDEVYKSSFMKFVDINSSTLTSLELRRFKLNVVDVQTLLESVQETLQEILFGVGDLFIDAPIRPVEFKALKLLKFWNVESAHPLAGFFVGSQTIQHIQYMFQEYPTAWTGEEHVQSFKRLFMSLKGLQKLQMGYPVCLKLFRDSEFVENAEFNLKWLQIWVPFYDPTNWRNDEVDENDQIEFECDTYTEEFKKNFYTFLQKQCNSLKVLWLRGFTIDQDTLHRILSMSSLKELHLSDIHFRGIEELTCPNPSIESLVLEFYSYFYDKADEGLLQIMQNCREIRSLFIYMRLSKTIIDAIGENLTKLERINECALKLLDPVVISGVHTLDFFWYPWIKKMEMADVFKKNLSIKTILYQRTCESKLLETQTFMRSIEEKYNVKVFFANPYTMFSDEYYGL